MPTIFAASIFKQSSSLVTRLNRIGVCNFSYRNVHGSKPLLIQSKVTVVIEERHSIMGDKEDFEKKGKGWKVLDEWSARDPAKKRKRSPRKPQTEKDKLEGLRQFLLKHDDEFRKEAVPASVRGKKDDENNSTKTECKSFRPKLIQEKGKKSTKSSKSFSSSSKYDSQSNSSMKSKFSSSSSAGASEVRDFQFSVLSYNILADNLMRAHPNLYTECHTERGVLDWNYRWEGVKREILSFQCPDIICLQEVQFQNPDHVNSHIVPFLSSIGYRTVLKPKTGTKDDGCLIAFSRERFLLEDTIPVNYKVDRVPVLDRDNVGLILKLVPQTTDQAGVTRQHSPILVATTHLLYNPKRTDVRLCQSALLLAELDRMAVSNKSLLPIIVTGDFNSEPWSPVLGLFLNKRHHYAGQVLARRGRAAPAKLLPDSLGLSDSCQWEVTLQQRGAQHDFVTGTGAFTHNLNFRSVYPPGGPVTTFQEGWAMVDYILYASHSDTLRLKGKKYLPSSQEMTSKGRIPSLECPSDHLPLLATFSLKLHD